MIVGDVTNVVIRVMTAEMITVTTPEMTVEETTPEINGETFEMRFVKMTGATLTREDGMEKGKMK